MLVICFFSFSLISLISVLILSIFSKNLVLIPLLLKKCFLFLFFLLNWFPIWLSLFLFFCVLVYCGYCNRLLKSGPKSRGQQGYASSRDSWQWEGHGIFSLLLPALPEFLGLGNTPLQSLPLSSHCLFLSLSGLLYISSSYKNSLLHLGPTQIPRKPLHLRSSI